MKTYHHVTPRENLKSIRQQGLIPRRGKRSAALGEEQDAVYLFTSPEAVHDALINWLLDEFEEKDELVVIDISLPDDFEITQKPGSFEATSSRCIPFSNITAVKEVL